MKTLAALVLPLALALPAACHALAARRARARSAVEAARAARGERGARHALTRRGAAAGALRAALLERREHVWRSRRRAAGAGGSRGGRGRAYGKRNRAAAEQDEGDGAKAHAAYWSPARRSVTPSPVTDQTL